MQEDLLAVQEQVVEEELAEHQLQSLLPPVLAGLLPLLLSSQLGSWMCQGTLSHQIEQSH